MNKEQLLSKYENKARILKEIVDDEYKKNINSTQSISNYNKLEFLNELIEDLKKIAQKPIKFKLWDIEKNIYRKEDFYISSDGKLLYNNFGKIESLDNKNYILYVLTEIDEYGNEKYIKLGNNDNLEKETIVLNENQAKTNSEIGKKQKYLNKIKEEKTEINIEISPKQFDYIKNKLEKELENRIKNDIISLDSPIGLQMKSIFDKNEIKISLEETIELVFLYLKEYKDKGN